MESEDSLPKEILSNPDFDWNAWHIEQLRLLRKAYERDTPEQVIKRNLENL